MTRRPTISEQLWPLDEASLQQAQEWAHDASSQILDWIWCAFDELYKEVLSKVKLTPQPEQPEREIVRLHYGRINQLWAAKTGGLSSLRPSHEEPEMETRSQAPAKPPAYDIAFVWTANPRIAWPVEAKIIPTPSTLDKYLGDIEKFRSGIDAPFTGEGALIAYLLSGTPDTFFNNLKNKTGFTLQIPEDFSNRPHRITLHARNQAPALRLHHLGMLCSTI